MKTQTIKTTDHPFMRAVQLHISEQLQRTTEAYMKMCFNDLTFGDMSSEDVREMGQYVKNAEASAVLARACVKWWCKEKGLNLRLVNDVATVLAINCHCDDTDENERMSNVLRANHHYCFTSFHKAVGFGDGLIPYLTPSDIDILEDRCGNFRISFAIATVYLGVIPDMLTLNDDGSVDVDWYKVDVPKPSFKLSGLNWGGTQRYNVL